MLFLVALFSLSTVIAQQPVALTLKDALNYALKANQNARKAKLDIENGQYQIDEITARALPQINGSGGVTYNPILQLSAIPGELFGNPGSTTLVAFGQKWNANAALSMSQTLFDHSVFTGIKAAKTTAAFLHISPQAFSRKVEPSGTDAEMRIDVVASCVHRAITGLRVGDIPSLTASCQPFSCAIPPIAS